MKRDWHDQDAGDGNGSPCASWTDRELVRHLQNHRDDRSFELLYNRHRSQLQYCALKVLQDEQLAEDVAQKVLIRLWEDPEKMDGERNPLGLLLRMAHDLAVDLVRKEQWFEEVGTDFEKILGFACSHSMSRSERAEFWACIESCLTGSQFQIMRLRFDYMFSINECAAKKGITPGTVKRLIHNSLKRLRTKKIPSTFLLSDSDSFRKP